MEEKNVYVVYGLDCDTHEEFWDFIGYPAFMRAFDSKEKAMDYFQKTCIKIAKNFIDGDDGPMFADIPEEELFQEKVVSNYDDNVSIVFWENENQAGWVVCDDNEIDDFDFITIYPRVYMKKIKID